MPPTDEVGPRARSSHPEALGDIVAGPFDVESIAGPPPGDNRCLGVEEADGSYLVTGRGHLSIGDNYMIHQYDHNGTYITSFPQVTLSTGWAGRDMEYVGGRLYVGSDNGEVSEYAWDGTTLVHVTLHQTAVPGTVRALCQDPSTGLFYTKSFTSDLYLFDLPGGSILNQVFDPSVSSYGFGWDANCSVIWSTTTNAAITRIDPVTGLNIGGGFSASSTTAIPGGLDVYLDSRNPSSLSAVQLEQDAPDSLVVYDLDGCGCSTSIYCTPKVNSLGCTPVISTDFGCPTGGASFHVRVTGKINQKAGMFFYGTGVASGPFQDGILCIAAPVKKSPILPTGGNLNPPNDCSGILTFDIGALGNPGDTLHFQGWSIDPWSGSGTSLSNAVTVSYQ